MPELPEVETIRRELERDVIGKRIKGTTVSGTRTVRRQTKKQFIARLDGTKITGVDRKGKYLLLKLDTGDVVVIHLRMSGQLLRLPNKEPTIKHTHVVVTFTQGGQLRFVDPRTFGELFVVNGENLAEEAPELMTLGVDPVEEPISWTVFARLMLAHPMKLKAFLMDQTLDRGDRQHLQRRDPVRRRPAVRPHDRLAVVPGDPPVVPRRGRDAARSDQVRRFDVGR